MLPIKLSLNKLNGIESLLIIFNYLKISFITGTLYDLNNGKEIENSMKMMFCSLMIYDKDN